MLCIAQDVIDKCPLKVVCDVSDTISLAIRISEIGMDLLIESISRESQMDDIEWNKK